MNTEHLDVLESNYRASSTIDELQWTRPDFEWLLRLARLGLWAEERGIPALTVYKNSPMLKRPGDFEGQLFFPARDALAALPAVGAAPGEGGEGD